MKINITNILDTIKDRGNQIFSGLSISDPTGTLTKLIPVFKSQVDNLSQMSISMAPLLEYLTPYMTLSPDAIYDMDDDEYVKRCFVTIPNELGEDICESIMTAQSFMVAMDNHIPCSIRVVDHGLTTPAGKKYQCLISSGNTATSVKSFLLIRDKSTNEFYVNRFISNIGNRPISEGLTIYDLITTLDRDINKSTLLSENDTTLYNKALSYGRSGPTIQSMLQYAYNRLPYPRNDGDVINVADYIIGLAEEWTRADLAYTTVVQYVSGSFDLSQIKAMCSDAFNSVKGIVRTAVNSLLEYVQSGSNNAVFQWAIKYFQSTFTISVNDKGYLKVVDNGALTPKIVWGAIANTVITALGATATVILTVINPVLGMVTGLFTLAGKTLVSLISAPLSGDFYATQHLAGNLHCFPSTITQSNFYDVGSVIDGRGVLNNILNEEMVSFCEVPGGYVIAGYEDGSKRRVVQQVHIDCNYYNYAPMVNLFRKHTVKNEVDKEIHHPGVVTTIPTMEEFLEAWTACISSTPAQQLSPDNVLVDKAYRLAYIVNYCIMRSFLWLYAFYHYTFVDKYGHVISTLEKRTLWSRSCSRAIDVYDPQSDDDITLPATNTWVPNEIYYDANDTGNVNAVIMEYYDYLISGRDEPRPLFGIPDFANLIPKYANNSMLDADFNFYQIGKSMYSVHDNIFDDGEYWVISDTVRPLDVIVNSKLWFAFLTAHDLPLTGAWQPAYSNMVYSVSLPRYDKASAIAGLVIGAMVTAAITASAVVIGFKVKKWLEMKQAELLAKAENQWSAVGSATTPQAKDEAFKQYRKTVIANNWLAKITGGTKLSTAYYWNGDIAASVLTEYGTEEVASSTEDVLKLTFKRLTGRDLIINTDLQEVIS